MVQGCRHSLRLSSPSSEAAPPSEQGKETASRPTSLFPFFLSSHSHTSCLTGEVTLLDSDEFMSFDCL